MNTSYKSKTKTSAGNQRSYFDWGSNMQIIQKGNGKIVMTEGELTRFFGVTWSKLNHRLQTVMKSSHLHPNEKVAGEEEIIINGQLKGYAALFTNNNHRLVLSIGQYGSAFVQKVYL